MKLKKWHIITAVSLIGIIILIFAGSLVYKYFLLPRYIEPVVEDVNAYVQNDAVLDVLYNEAIKLHDEGIMDDATYTTFLRAYSDHFRDDEEYARQILAQKEENTNPVNEETALRTKYASHKVGIEIIKVIDGWGSGSADIKYSDRRTSDRVKAEDYVEAEQIVEKAESTAEPTATPSVVQSAYEKLRSKMTAGDFSSFTRIMGKLSISTLQSYISDKEGLKAYLHSQLSDSEYREIVNLGYKYVYVFLNDN